MSDIAIRISGLSKRYRIGAALKRPQSARAAVGAALKSPFRYLGRMLRPPTEEETLWALKDVSFEVKPGEVVGIIGRNGAGKSTLLKILSRITEPTEGLAELHGRVGSLLEVGVGFNPELTGRENIYLNGAILGMKRAEIARKFDEIVAFSEVERFLDTPVKHYSSGMYVRLAFAVAAHLQPEILVVDEVLAVGDAAFQKKCLGKMENVAKTGRTVLFVSHNMQSVVKLCGRCIELKSGSVAEDGPSADVVTRYLSDMETLKSEMTWDSVNEAPGDKEFLRYRATRLVLPDGGNKGFLFIDQPFWIETEYEILRPLDKAWLGLEIVTADGQSVFCSGDENIEAPMRSHRKPGVYKTRCAVPANLLNQGCYTVSLISHIPGIRVLASAASVIRFEVLQRQDIAGPGRMPGVVRPLLNWTVEKTA